MNQDKNFSARVKPCPCLLNFNAISAGNVKPSETAVVAPVNLKAVQILGIIVDPKYISTNSTAVKAKDLFLLSVRGADPSNTKASTVCRREKCITGKTRIK
ncbi:hypothetical protein CsSME_00052538 [Camellia sinensis var. sinensis]